MSSPALTRSSDSATPALFPSDDLETRTALRGVIGHQHHAEVWPLPVGIGELRGHRAPQELIGVPAILHFDGNKPVERCVALLATCVLLPPGQEVGQIGVGATLHEAGHLRLSSDTRHKIPSPTQNRLHEPLPDPPLQEADVGADCSDIHVATLAWPSVPRSNSQPFTSHIGARDWRHEYPSSPTFPNTPSGRARCRGAPGSAPRAPRARSGARSPGSRGRALPARSARRGASPAPRRGGDAPALPESRRRGGA